MKKKPFKKTSKTNLLTEIISRKKEDQASGSITGPGSFSKFLPTQPRNSKKSPVGPSRGGRKGN